MKKFLTIFFLLLLFTAAMKAQEMVCPLTGNPALSARAANSRSLLKSMQTIMPDTLSLPFFDDFASSLLVPDPRWWTDQSAFVNYGFAWNPVSIGVATLDALDSTGHLYSTIGTGSTRADLLSSKPIHLAYPADSNIYLSFFYQPQGMSHRSNNLINTGDSLYVQFFAPNQHLWKTVWMIPGDSLRPFKQVFIHIADTAYLQDGFRFRFGNYASVSVYAEDPTLVANNGVWNIDYVYLNKGRSASDTLIDDVAITQPLPSLLDEYQSIPWTHFAAAANDLMKSGKTSITYKNYSGIVKGVQRTFKINSLYTSYTYSFPTNSINIYPYSGQLYQPQTEKFLDEGGDSARFRELFYLTTDTVASRNIYRWNDTISRTQDFLNYYAYDDGTAEQGYGVQGDSRGSQVAYKFYTYQTDTLRAIAIYFNNVYEGLNQFTFELAVWNDGGNQPGNLVYSMSDSTTLPVFNTRNQFVTYTFNQPVIVSDTFYIGWIQQGAGFLNVGLDMNHVNNDKLYYNTTGSWTPSVIPATLMMRPILGQQLATPVTLYKAVTTIDVYPNPASNELYVRMPGNPAATLRLQVYSMQGTMLLSGTVSGNPLNITSLAPGAYIIRIVSENGVPGYRKILIVK